MKKISMGKRPINANNIIGLAVVAAEAFNKGEKRYCGKYKHYFDKFFQPVKLPQRFIV